MKAPSRTATVILLAALAASLPLFLGPYPQAIGQVVFLYMSLALSWDMLLRSGQISFGIAGFFGLGAYTSVIAVLDLHVAPVVSILLGALVSGGIAYLLGLVVLRLRGMYFAIVTLALAEIFRIIMSNWTSLTGGTQGRVLDSVIFAGSSRSLYWVMLCVAAATIICSEVFRRTRIHFALTSIRDDEVAAASSGINITRYLAVAFGVASALQGLTGAAYAQVYGFVTPDGSFSVDFTLLPLAMALLGGIYGTVGPIIGAVLLGVIGEYLKLFIPYGHQIAYGLIVTVVILFMPRGIAGLARRLRGGRSTDSAPEGRP